MKRFLDKVEKTDSCWLWTAGKRNKDGYGAFRLNDKIIDAHRVSYLLFKGELSDPKLIVCHTCDNKLCVNPEHLYLGTYKDNLTDAYVRGTRNKRPINLIHGTKHASNQKCKCKICRDANAERMRNYRKNKK
jgi:hypothetical protein